jgi:ribosome maturation factor RimP
MAEIKEKLQVLLSPILESHNAFLTDILVRNEPRGKLLQVFLDTDEGITIEQCAHVSRELSHEIDRENLFERAYRLEVSSPGIDRPLRMLRQYTKNLGRTFRVIHQVLDSRQTLIGKLESVAGDKLTFLVEGGESITIEFSKIIESKEELPW